MGSNDNEAAKELLLSCSACVIPGGHDVPQAASLGENGKATLAAFLEEQGKGIVGICGGAWLLGHGDGRLNHNYCWFPCRFDPNFGDNGLMGMVDVHATKEAVGLFGDGVEGSAYFDESPSMSLIGAPPDAKVLVRYGPNLHPSSFSSAAALQEMGEQKTKGSLAGTAAVVAGHSRSFASLPRVVLIGPHWEVTPGETKRNVVTRAVAWASGRDVDGAHN
ncbi:expressed unknown protein [Seminavis robusta]|uniref:Biotin-protein ligase N-terminal domain-containing protein n=1 Tax=Seminavis robusta TaxID=568900 RepID=A0A9N8F476_9STRA|nr:expressed unknown protein [Seminavis robusta]|eukprot:Sro3955_g352150.1 n/a (220) ;mRNA; r:790-1449